MQQFIINLSYEFVTNMESEHYINSFMPRVHRAFQAQFRMQVHRWILRDQNCPKWRSMTNFKIYLIPISIYASVASPTEMDILKNSVSKCAFQHKLIIPNYHI